MAGYFHGGAPGLRVGGYILPPCLTGAPSSASYGAADVCRRDRVYITLDPRLATVAACLHHSGRGCVYVVEPEGEFGPDPDDGGQGKSFECERARITAVRKVRGKLIKKLQKVAIERPWQFDEVMREIW